MRSLLQRLLPPEVREASSDTLLKGRLIVGFSLAITACTIPNLGQLLANGLRTLATIVVIGMVMVLLAPVLLYWSKSVRVAAHWLLAVWCITLGSITFFDGGVASPALVFHSATPVLAVMLLGIRGGMIWTGILAVESVALLVLAKKGMLPEVPISIDLRTQSFAVAGITALFTTCALARLYEKRKSDLFATVERAKSNAEQAHASARIVLDNVVQGLLIADRHGRLDPEQSLAIEKWFGKQPAGATLFTLFGAVAPDIAGWLEVGYSDVFEDVLPREVTLAQLPRAFSYGGSELAVEYQLIEAPSQELRMLVVITDVTRIVATEQAEAERSELLSVVQSIMRDRTTFLVSFEEMRVRNAILVSGNADGRTELRELHTLKGNAGMLGLTRFARLCHEIEDEVTLDEGTLGPQHRATLAKHWADLNGRLAPLLAGEVRGIELSQQEFDDALEAVLRREPYPALAARMRTWTDEPARRRLEAYGDEIRSLADRLGKGVVDVRIDDGGVRLDRERFGDLFAGLVHLVRNAVDHGIEMPDERRDTAKAQSPTIHLTTRLESDQLIVTVADDGRGICWQRLREKAQERGLAAATHDDLVALIFADGVSTAERVTEISGRGMGLAALKQSVEQLGGRLEVASEPGYGSTFRIRVPRTAAAECRVVDVGGVR